MGVPVLEDVNLLPRDGGTFTQGYEPLCRGKGTRFSGGRSPLFRAIGFAFPTDGTPFPSDGNPFTEGYGHPFPSDGTPLPRDEDPNSEGWDPLS